MWWDLSRNQRQIQNEWHREPARIRFQISLQADPGSRLILFQDLIDPGPVMGDPGEDDRGLCIRLSIGDNALGYPSAEKRAP